MTETNNKQEQSKNKIYAGIFEIEIIVFSKGEIIC